MGELIGAGKLDEAKALSAEYAEVPIGRLDPTGPDFCTEAGVKTRVDVAAQNVSRALADVAQKSSDPVLRYVVLKDAFDSQVGQAGRAIGYLCQSSQAELFLAYTDASGPVRDSTERLLGELRDDAVSRGGIEFDRAVALAEASQAAENDRASLANCKALRRASEVTTSPAMTMGRDFLLRNCANMVR